MKKILKFILLVSAIGLISLMIYNIALTFKYSAPANSEVLTDEDIGEVAFIEKLKRTGGDKIWPGFDTTDIPVILFNDKYEFLFYPGLPDTSWALWKTQNTNDFRIYRRLSDHPQAFAVRAGNKWAGSLGCLTQMNREMFWGIRDEMPVIINRMFPFFLIEITEDIHISGVMHEMFHAFQANLNEGKFQEAERSHTALKDYPQNSMFAGYWNREGHLLLKALRAENPHEMYAFTERFLTARDERRIICNLQNRHILMEKKLEWLEGLAKYAEIKCYLAGSEFGDKTFVFRKKNPYWQTEQTQRLGHLGDAGGDNRFYHSGAAMGLILDRINPMWKDEIMNDSVYPEDFLRSYIRQRSTDLL